MEIVIKTQVESLTKFEDKGTLHVSGWGTDIPIEVCRNGDSKEAYISMNIPEGTNYILLNKEQLQGLIDGINKLEKIIASE